MTKKAYGSDDKNLRSVRFEAIRRLISEEKISTQQDLMVRLQDCGFSVTQGTVSRDIRDLHLSKVSIPEGGYRYVMNDQNTPSGKFRDLFRSQVIRVDHVLNQVVVKCYSGMANAVCAAMDGMELRGVLGTIAGDDTILIVADSQESAEKLAMLFGNIS